MNMLARLKQTKIDDKAKRDRWARLKHPLQLARERKKLSKPALLKILNARGLMLGPSDRARRAILRWERGQRPRMGIATVLAEVLDLTVEQVRSGKPESELTALLDLQIAMMPRVPPKHGDVLYWMIFGLCWRSCRRWHPPKAPAFAFEGNCRTLPTRRQLRPAGVKILIIRQEILDAV